MQSEMKSTLPFLFYWLNRVPGNLHSALDLGAGRGVVGAMLQTYREPAKLDAIEIHEPYAQFASRFYTSMTIGNAVEKIAALPAQSYDIVTCFEMIEHLSKDQGLVLLKEMERVGKFVFVSTPSTFFPQPEYDNNVHQVHLSLWTARDFRSRGYSVRGFGRAQWWFGLGPALLAPGLCANIFAWKNNAAR